MRSIVGAAILMLVCGSNLPAAVFVETDGFFFYFPPNEQRIAADLVRQAPAMTDFLSRRGLVINPPLHIVLDENLDAPQVNAHVIPHREIRIPLRAPGVLEDGYLEADPWGYFLFKGLCLQGIYAIRGGVPGALHTVFGDLMSPNVIFPPWVEDGICSLLWELYRGAAVSDPFEAAVFGATPPPDLDLISHHPQVWPGYLSSRIYGKPFLRWLHERYGWDRILEFLREHGRGVIPIEIDLKTRRVFGRTGYELWGDFQRRFDAGTGADQGLLALGYWAQPFVYWDHAGVFPGKLQLSHRGRYGVAESDGTVWLSQYEGKARIYRYRSGSVADAGLEHVWDPGPGSVAVTRSGSRPWLIVFPDDGRGGFRAAESAPAEALQMIAAPEGVIQLSGPVRDDAGRIAVAANRAGNWDVWVHDGAWRQVTTTAAVDMDPWWENGALVYASNATGTFQIQGADGAPLTRVEHMAVLPRQGQYMSLTPNGWQILAYEVRAGSAPDLPAPQADSPPVPAAPAPVLETRPYSPFPSLWPNYIRPDLFAAVDDLQLGLATKSRDVTGDYRFDAGLRYSFDMDYVAFRLGFQARSVGTQLTRYPVSYTTDADQVVDESRYEAKLFWRPLDIRELEDVDILRATEGLGQLEGLELSANWRWWEPLEDIRESDEPSQDEAWLGIAALKSFDLLRLWGNLELFTEDRQSLSLGGRLLFGDQVLTSAHFMFGRAWGDAPDLGHTWFRIGGNVSEGYFTRRPSKLFPVRGFDSNLIEAPKAAAAGIEVFWPLANLQMGYYTLPLFLHRLQLGTFVDAGIAGEELKSEDWLLSAGFEFVTSLEIAWGNFSAFRMGVAWPLVYPDYVKDDSPKFVFQLGRPL